MRHNNWNLVFDDHQRNLLAKKSIDYSATQGYEQQPYGSQNRTHGRE